MIKGLYDVFHNANITTVLNDNKFISDEYSV